MKRGAISGNDKEIIDFLKVNKLFKGTPFSCLKSCLSHFE
jgi:hypothetical protein